MSKRYPRAKWVLPIVVDPPERLCFTIEVPNDVYHLAAFRGAILNLCSAMQWQDDLAHTAKDVALVWRDVYAKIKACETIIQPFAGAEGDEQMIRQNPDNPCELQTSIDGITWCTFADFSKCLPAAPQPGGGSPQPPVGGGEQCYQLELQANSRALLPTPVSTGDLLSVQYAIGAGNDGTISPWQCPEGETFFAGVCIDGTGGVDGGDPLPTTNHMALLYKIAGSYYPATEAPFTVPGGLSNEQVEIQVNDSNIADNAGSYQLSICVTNNSEGTWSHTFDFETADGGWTAPNATLEDVWTPGVGWVGTANASAAFTGVQIDRVHSSRTVTSLTVYFNIASGDGTQEWDLSVQLPGVVLYGSGTPANGDNVKGNVGTATSTKLRVSAFSSTTSHVTGTATITKIVVVGEGTDPF